jgi:hypothetical protein
MELKGFDLNTNQRMYCDMQSHYTYCADKLISKIPCFCSHRLKGNLMTDKPNRTISQMSERVLKHKCG